MSGVFRKSLKGAKRFKRLLGVHGQKKGLSCGLVVLGANESVGLHNTGHKEEAVIILEGKARVSYGSKSVAVKERAFIYIPRNTAHNIENTGNCALKYVYVTSG